MPSWTAPLDPAETKDYSVDWSELVGTDDTITSVSFELGEKASAAGVVIISYFRVGSVSTVMLSVSDENKSDQFGQQYPIIATVTTDGGRTYQRTINLTIRQL